MVEIIFHDRGSQGTVIASKILANSVAKELKKSRKILINSSKRPGDFEGLVNDFNVFTIEASEIDPGYQLGPDAIPIVNTAILGAVLKIYDFVNVHSVESIKSVSAGVFPGAKKTVFSKLFRKHRKSK